MNRYTNDFEFSILVFIISYTFALHVFPTFKSSSGDLNIQVNFWLFFL